MPLPGTDLGKAQLIIDRIKASLSAYPLTIISRFAAASALQSFIKTPTSPSDAIRQVDKLMYDVKKSGKKCRRLLRRSITLPGTAGKRPAVTAAIPVARRPEIAIAADVPVTVHPDMLPTIPSPVTANPDVIGTRRRRHDLNARH